jgi:nucleotide-binding universal stress UspA family protein
VSLVTEAKCFFARAWKLLEDAMHAAVIPIVPAIALKRILYATDFSEGSRAALPIVSAIARRYHAEVYAANVRPPMPYTMYSPEAVSTLDNKRERETREELSKLLQGTEMSGLAASAVIEIGDPAEELQRMVRDLNIDLVVVATHGRTGVMRFLMGSLAEELFRNLPVPVLTVGPRLSRRFASIETIKTILYPTDLSAESRAMFPFVASLAAEYRAKIVLLHVISSSDALSSTALELAARARGQMQKLFAGEIDPRCEVEMAVDFGDTADRTLNAAREYHADLVAFGVRPAGEASTHFRNTVAYKVVLEAECPVLTSRTA